MVNTSSALVTSPRSLSAHAILDLHNLVMTFVADLDVQQLKCLRHNRIRANARPRGSNPKQSLHP